MLAVVVVELMETTLAVAVAVQLAEMVATHQQILVQAQEAHNQAQTMAGLV
jgi:hypothetical protein